MRRTSKPVYDRNSESRHEVIMFTYIVEDRTAVETLHLSASQDPHTSKVRAFIYRSTKNFLKVLLFNNCRSKS
jgi:hypothetical protein